jgi:hypothetical protein
MIDAFNALSRLIAGHPPAKLPYGAILIMHD